MRRWYKAVISQTVATNSACCMKRQVVIASKVSSAFPHICCINVTQRKRSQTQGSAGNLLLPIFAEQKREWKDENVAERYWRWYRREGGRKRGGAGAERLWLCCFHHFSLWAACPHRLHPVCLQWLPAVSPGWAPGPRKCQFVCCRKCSRISTAKVRARGMGDKSPERFVFCFLGVCFFLICTGWQLTELFCSWWLWNVLQIVSWTWGLQNSCWKVCTVYTVS